MYLTWASLLRSKTSALIVMNGYMYLNQSFEGKF